MWCQELWSGSPERAGRSDPSVTIAGRNPDDVACLSGCQRRNAATPCVLCLLYARRNLALHRGDFCLCGPQVRMSCGTKSDAWWRDQSVQSHLHTRRMFAMPALHAGHMSPLQWSSVFQMYVVVIITILCLNNADILPFNFSSYRTILPCRCIMSRQSCNSLRKLLQRVPWYREYTNTHPSTLSHSVCRQVCRLSVNK